MAAPRGNQSGKPVTLCGEMAGLPRCFLPLFGMGLRRLSMSPGFVPSIKEMVRRTKAAQASLLGQFREREVRKEYRALVAGAPPLDEGVVDLALGPDGSVWERVPSRWTDEVFAA